MSIKKFILAVFIVFALSFSYQPASAFLREKTAIVYILDLRKDIFTDDFIKRNETRRFEILVSLTFQHYMRDKGKVFFNSS